MSSSHFSKSILQVLPGLHTGGVEKTTLDIGQAIVNRGWRSVVASSGGRLLNELIDQGSHHVQMPLQSKNPITIWRNAARLSKLIVDENIMLIHARSRAPAWSALMAARRTGIPLVTTYHGAYNQNNFIKGWYNSVMARADVVIANSTWTAELIKARNPWASTRITTIHRGTDFTEFSQAAISSKRRSDLRQNWGLGEEDFVVLQLARLTGWKGQSVVIETAERLIKDFPKLRFVLAGDAQGRDDYLVGLKQKISASGLQNVVILPGHCADPAAAMAIADCVVVASIEAEAFGRAAVEASALERPLIVTRIGAVGETVLAAPEVRENERTGWKVTPSNSLEMSNALREILSLTPNQRQIIGIRARHYCEQNFLLSQMCEKNAGSLRKVPVEIKHQPFLKQLQQVAVFQK